jgi:hypothetical protein
MGTLSRYTDSTMSVSLGTVQVSYSLVTLVDPGSPIGIVVTKIFDTQNAHRNRCDELHGVPSRNGILRTIAAAHHQRNQVFAMSLEHPFGSENVRRQILQIISNFLVLGVRDDPNLELTPLRAQKADGAIFQAFCESPGGSQDHPRVYRYPSESGQEARDGEAFCGDYSAGAYRDGPIKSLLE